MKINEKGFWENDTAEGHGHDAGLADAIVTFLKKEGVKEVFDFGCGTGYYSKKMYDAGITAIAVDGNPHTKDLVDKNLIAYVKDLSLPVKFLPADWVLSLEVGEHIPAEFEDVFLDNLDKHNKKGIILSWAVPGQGGDGHVNCKTNDSVALKLWHLGYNLDTFATGQLRESVATYPTPCYWFRDTLMVFRKNKETCSQGYIFSEG